MPERYDPLTTPGATTSSTTRTAPTTGVSGAGSDPFGTSSIGTTSASEEGTTGRIAEKAREMTSKVTDRAAEQVNTMFDAQKSRALDGIGGISTALRRTAESLRSEQQATTASYVEMAADQIENLTTRFADRDLDDVLYEVQTYARRNPAVFFGAALGLGFVAARFLKASSDRARDRYGYDYSYEEGLYAQPQGASRSGYESYGAADVSRSSGTAYGNVGGTGYSTGTAGSTTRTSSADDSQGLPTRGTLGYGEDV